MYLLKELDSKYLIPNMERLQDYTPRLQVKNCCCFSENNHYDSKEKKDSEQEILV